MLRPALLLLVVAGCDLLGTSNRTRRKDLDHNCVDTAQRPFAYFYSKPADAESDGCLELYTGDRPASEHGHMFCCRKREGFGP